MMRQALRMLARDWRAGELQVLAAALVVAGCAGMSSDSRVNVVLRGSEQNPPIATSASGMWVVTGTVRNVGPASIIATLAGATPHRSATNSVWPGCAKPMP